MTLEFNYYRHDGDYSDIHLYLKRESGVSGAAPPHCPAGHLPASVYEYLLPLTLNDYGAGVTYDFGDIENAPTATLCVTRGGEVIERFDTLADLTNTGGDGRLALYAIQGVGELISVPGETPPALRATSPVRGGTDYTPEPPVRTPKRGHGGRAPAMPARAAGGCSTLYSALLLCAAGVFYFFRKLKEAKQ